MDTTPKVKFYTARLDSWGHEKMLKEAVGIKWRNYLQYIHLNVWAIYRSGGTYRPLGYIVTTDESSSVRIITDLKLLEDLHESEVSEILKYLESGPSLKLQLDPTKILQRENYELLVALGAAKDESGVYRVGIAKRGTPSVEADKVLTKEQLLKPRGPFPGSLPPR